MKPGRLTKQSLGLALILLSGCDREPPLVAQPIGYLPVQTIKAEVVKSFGVFRDCYAVGTIINNNLRGHITVGFAIAPNGKVAGAWEEESSLPGPVSDCVVDAFLRFQFPPPENGYVTVLYPLEFKKALYKAGPEANEQPFEPKILGGL